MGRILSILILVLGVLLGLLVLVVSTFVVSMSGVFDEPEHRAPGVIGIVCGGVFLAATAISIRLPRLSMMMFLGTGCVLMAIEPDYNGSWVFGVAGIVLAILVYVRWRREETGSTQ